MPALAGGRVYIADGDSVLSPQHSALNPNPAGLPRGVYHHVARYQLHVTRIAGVGQGATGLSEAPVLLVEPHPEMKYCPTVPSYGEVLVARR